MLQICSGCGGSKQRDDFSKGQLAKPNDHRRCKDCTTAGCPVLPTCCACGAHKQPDQFSKAQLAKSNAQRRCRDCITVQHTVLTCSGCSLHKQPDQFSSSQLSKAARFRSHKLRCRDCVAEGQRFCNACCLMRQAAQFSEAQLAKPSDQWRCRDCVTGGHDIAVDEDSSTASDKGPMVRVRDVQKHYGHLCEIPLEAYMEAEVAWSRNDLVSESDVEAASNAWDARSIAHDIDTQWGAMPWGGAYKDSNRYYGPGCFDYY